MSTWLFTQPLEAPRTATVMLAVFGRGPLRDDVAFDPAVHGAADAARYELRTIARAADLAWFDAWRSGSLRAIAERDLDAAALADLDAADCIHMVSADVALPAGHADMGYLQGAWAIVRSLVARVAAPATAVVLDAHCMRYLAPRSIAPVDAALDVGREIQIIFETDSARSDRAHALHTRGMIKFGAPDLVALCTDADADLVCRVMAQVAASVARGTDIAEPRHGIDLSPTVTWYLVADEHGLAELLQLNNRARVLVGDNGANLMGVAAELVTSPRNRGQA